MAEGEKLCSHASAMSPVPLSAWSMQCSVGPSGRKVKEQHVLIYTYMPCFIVPHFDTSHFLALVVCAGFNLKGQLERGDQVATETWCVGTLCLITHKFTAACQEGGRELVPWKGQALCGGFT